MRVVVGMSGGVDSSVAAWLLQQQGHEVIGIFMRNWHNDDELQSQECPWEEDRNDAMMVAQKLGIPFLAIDFSAEYKERIVNYMFREYAKGRTPNPDVLCNREIKFDIFLKKALELGADFVATGHYCRKDTVVADGQQIHRLLAGSDHNKDQSYFLCQVSQEQLSKALFPIGDITKPQVREIAREMKLATAEKKDSQGICFIGKVDLPTFLKQRIAPQKGPVVEIPPLPLPHHHPDAIRSDAPENLLASLAAPHQYALSEGAIIGQHNGSQYYTVGQRHGLNIGGKAEPLFVISIDAENNIVYAGMGEQHQGLNRPALFIRKEDVHWIREDLAALEGECRQYQFRIRYRQPLQAGRIFFREKGAYILFDRLQRGISPGQFAAWYDGDELIGSGEIA
jgi:tRNA-uridine 2-sulfurtransferase